MAARRCSPMYIARALLALATLAAIPAAAGAQTPGDAALSLRLYGKIVRNELASVCFRKVYDSRHMAAHPDQNVTSMLLLISAIPTPESKIAPTKMEMGVTFRNGSQVTDLGNFCSVEGNELLCRDGCEGGTQVTFPAPGVAQVKLLDVISVYENPQSPQPGAPDGEPAETPLTKQRFGPDDRIFRLERVKLTDCLPIASDPQVRLQIERAR